MSLATLNTNINANANVAVSEFGKVQVAAKDSMGKSSAAVDSLRDSMAVASRGAEQSMQSMSRSMNMARDATTGSMGKSADSVDQLAESVLAASQSMEKAAASIQQSMAASGNAVVKSADESAKALDSLNDVDLTKMQKTVAASMGATFGAASVATKTFLEDAKSAIETKLVIIGLALATGVAAAVFTGLYAAYKATDFVVGLFTGESYKSASIDALIAVNDKVKELQDTLHVTAQDAMATGAALENLGVSKSDYSSVYVKASEAIHNNAEEMDRLGVKYGTTEQIIHNANEKLNEYTEGWDRNQAAAAMGLGTAAQVAAAAKVTSAELGKAKERLDDYNLGLGGDTQEAVKRYEDAMRAFNRETDLTAQGFSRAWADQIMPVLTDLSEFLSGGLPYAVNAFRYSMATITSLFYGLKTVVYMVAESILGSIEAIGSGLSGLASAAMKALSGDFSGAKNSLIQGWTDAKTRLGGIGDNIVAQARSNSAAMRQAWAMDDRAGAGSAKPKGRDWIAKPETPDDPAKEKKAAQVAAEISDYEKLMKAINEKISVQEMEIAGDHALTDGEKLAAKFATDLRDNKLNLIATAGKSVEMQKIELAAGLEKLIQDERANEAKKSAIKMADELAASGQKEIKTLEDQLKAQRDHNDEIGLTVEQLGALKSSKLDAAAASDEELAANLRIAANYAGPLHDAYLQYADALDRAAKLNRDLSSAETDGATKQAATDAAKKKAEEWQKTIDQYDHVFQQGFADMVNGGKNAWKSFTTSLVTTFKTTVADQIYKMFAQPFVVKMVGSLLGVFGASGMASAADGSGSAMGAVSMLSSVNSAYSAINTGFAGMSSSVASGVQSGMNLFSGSGGFIGQGPMQVSGFAQGIGTAAGVAAGAAIGVYGGRMISGQYGSNSTVNAGTAIGAAVGSFMPVIGTAIGAAVGGLIGGVLNRAFGMGDKKATSSGIEGNFGSSGFAGNSFVNWQQDGGWFRSDKSGHDTSALDSATTKQFTDGFASIKSVSSDFAKSLGLDASSIANYSKKISVALTGKAEEDAKAIAALFAGMGEDIAYQMISGKSAVVDSAYYMAQNPDVAKNWKSGDAQDHFDKYGRAEGRSASANAVIGPDYSYVLKENETYSAALQRLSVSLSAVNGMFDTLNVKLLETSIAGGDTASKLVDLFGGLDNMKTVSAGYFQSFYSDQEKVDIATRQLGKTFADLGFVMPANNAALRAQIEAQDLSTDAGRKAYAQLMGLSGAFASLSSSADQLAKASANAAAQNYFNAIDSKKQAAGLTDEAGAALDKFFGTVANGTDANLAAAQAANSAAKTAADNWRAIAGTIRSTLDGIRGGTEQLTGGYASSLAKFQSLTVLARGGDADSAGKLSGAAQAFLTASESKSVTMADYLRDRYKIENSLTETLGSTDALASAQDLIVQNTAATVTALNAMNTTLTGFAADVYEMLQKGYKGGTVEDATKAAAGLAQLEAGWSTNPYWGSSKEGDKQGYESGGSFTRLAGDVTQYTGANGAIYYLKGTESVLDIAKRIPEIRAVWEKQYGIKLPAFAAGGDHTGGLRIVGEHGWEVESTGPSRIFNQQQLGQALRGGGDNSELVVAINLLKEEVAMLRKAADKTADNTKQSADILDRSTAGGGPTLVRIVAA
ncbi:phage tail tape measure protein [Herminiimonas sp. CN]|uniref:phage tail tape measure protein n=1 Tax=Herminiimonas sp. CN TaxID=1349818 RepID=UPI000473B819|nr:phage tail tape measure protein [Herminiimonas sp. CN]